MPHRHRAGRSRQRGSRSVGASASLRRSFASRSRDITSEAVLPFLEQLNTPRALTAWLLFKYGEHRQLVELPVPDSERYGTNVDLFRRDYAATKFFSKTEGLRTGIDTDAVALASAEQAEQKCKATNHAWRAYNRGVIPTPDEPAILRARAMIARVLGAVPATFPVVGWSPGRTTMCDTTLLSPVDKFTSDVDVTIRARSRLLAEMRASPQWSAAVLNADAPASVLQSAVRVAPGNVMRIVPKNAKTGRVICFEPHGNIRLQLAVGAYIRQRLRRVGVNLNDQSVNQRRARLASIYGLLATLDLRSASDTLAIEVVYALLPIEWALLLDDLRSHATLWPGETVPRRNEKFSSMGNGFTFELESLIFYALASAVDDQVSVYGDDIICSTHGAPRVIEILRVCGFEINTSKSFTTGFFRESCGADMFRGYDVSPVYLRRVVTSQQIAIALHNRIREWIARSSSLKVVERRWLSVLDRIRHLVPGALLGPSGFGDGHLHVDLDVARPTRASNGVEGWWFSTVSVRQWDRWKDDFGRFIDLPARYFRSALAAALLKDELPPSRDIGFQQKTGKLRYVVVRTLASFWPELTWV